MNDRYVFAGAHAFGAKLPSLLASLRLQEMAVENDNPVVGGTSELARMMAMSAVQLRSKYLKTGTVTERDLDEYAEFTEDPRASASYYATVRVAARKPL